MRRNYLKLVVATVSGNVMEWYDFALYGYFATIIAGLFFPSNKPFLSLLLTFSTFAVGVGARLLGSILFGSLGDRYGRRFSLLLSLVFISLSTLCIGLLPTYNAIGVWAPVLLIVCRLAQGLAVSSELTTAGIYLIESAHQGRQGLNGSMVMCSTYIGLLLGALVCTLVTCFFDAKEIEHFAWRIPFLFSLALGVMAIFSRIKAEDSPVFQSLLIRSEQISKPVFTVMKSYLLRLILIFGMSSVLAVAIYLLIGYLPSYFMVYLSMDSIHAMKIIVFGLASLIIFVPLLGYMSDRVGHYNLYITGCLLFIVFACSSSQLSYDGVVRHAFLGMLLLTAPLAFIAASIMPIIINVFPSDVRCTGTSIGYGSSMAIFGGTAPLVALIGSHYFKTSFVAITYLLVTAVLSLVSVCYLQRISNREEYLLQESLSCRHRFL